MKKIMMTKYGFVRWPEEDFSDDGNRFTCYRVGQRVRVSKCTYEGTVFLSASINGTKLPYEVYSKLPHYSALDKLNGVSINALTDNDLFDLCEACLMYEKEYTEAEVSIVYPSEDEIRNQCVKVKAKRMAELAEVEALLASNVTRLALTLQEWQWKTMREYLVGLKKLTEVDVDDRTHVLINSSYSFNFIKADDSELQASYYYKYIMDLIKSVQA